jgi:SAM-dependent methyltransferase
LGEVNFKEPKAPVDIDRVGPMEETASVRDLDWGHVQVLAEALRAKAELPPVDVVKLAFGNFGLLAGYHRRAAHLEADRTKIRIRIVEGLDVEDWHPYAVRSNAAHGKPLTPAERKAAARRMLEDNPRRSDRAIASDCGLSPTTVGKIRGEGPEEEEGTVHDGQLRVGRDGKARRMPTPVPPGGLDAEFDQALDSITENVPSLNEIERFAGDMEQAADPPISKPDLGGGISHPARFSDAIIAELARLLSLHHAGPKVLDPFAGTGRIHQLPYETFGVELEPEWANMHINTRVGTALDLPFPDGHFDTIVTSPCYGNRLADHHNARDPESRRSYTHDLGRPLSPGNAGVLQWGPEYRDFHQRAWKEAARVLHPGALFVLNIKDHTREGSRQYVGGWHVTALCRLGFDLLEHVPVETPSLRVGENSEARWPEQVYVLRYGEAVPT